MTELIIALDTEYANNLIPKLYRIGVKTFKLNAASLLQNDFGCILQTLKNRNCDIFLDLKLYDTFDTVKRISEKIFNLRIKFLTVYSSKRMLEAAMLMKISEDQKIIAVQGLTDDLSVNNTTSALIADGMICSAYVVEYLRDWGFSNKILICPGIRQYGQHNNNHQKPATPIEAKNFGADYIIVGRPIVNSPDPIEAAKSILEELGN